MNNHLSGCLEINHPKIVELKNVFIEKRKARMSVVNKFLKNISGLHFLRNIKSSTTGRQRFFKAKIIITYKKGTDKKTLALYIFKKM